MSRRKPSEGRLTLFRYIYTRREKNTLRTASTRSKYIFQFLSKFFRKGVDMCFMVCYNINIPWGTRELTLVGEYVRHQFIGGDAVLNEPRIPCLQEWGVPVASTKTHLKSQVVKEKTKKPIIMRHWRNYRQAQDTQNIPVEIPYRFKSDMPHQLEIIKQIVFGDI